MKSDAPRFTKAVSECLDDTGKVTRLEPLYALTVSLELENKNLKHDVDGFLFCYKTLMEAAPWTESNDMDIADEMSCGLNGLIQERDTLKGDCDAWNASYHAALKELNQLKGILPP